MPSVAKVRVLSKKRLDHKPLCVVGCGKRNHDFVVFGYTTIYRYDTVNGLRAKNLINEYRLGGDGNEAMGLKSGEEVVEDKTHPAAAVVLEAMPCSVIVLDLDGNVTYLNPEYEKNSGYKREEFIGKHFLELAEATSVKPEDVKKIALLFKKAIKKGSSGPVELALPTKDGRKAPVYAVTGVIKDAQGKPTHVVAAVRDITELKRLQEKEKEASIQRVRALEAEKARKLIQKKAAGLEGARKLYKRQVRDLRKLLVVLMEREKRMIELTQELYDIKQLDKLKQKMRELGEKRAPLPRKRSRPRKKRKR